jgi:hypothetical protein
VRARRDASAGAPSSGREDERERARKTRRRARDAQAERRAVQAVIVLFLGFGGLGFLALNLPDGGFAGSGAGERSEGRAEPRGERGGAGRRPRDGAAPGRPSRARGAARGAASNGPARQSTAHLDETPDLPALRHLERRGLTAGAEGIPRVETDASGAVSAVAGLEACRFAYGVWEFSPNQTFRFISTCRGLGRMELVGAYEVREARVHLSELSAGHARWTGVFDVEKPSIMRSHVRSETGGRTIELDVTQRITVVRGGLHGDDFRDSFRRRNRLSVPSTGGEDARPPAEETPPRRQRSPLEELLGGS